MGTFKEESINESQNAIKAYDVPITQSCFFSDAGETGGEDSVDQNVAVGSPVFWKDGIVFISDEGFDIPGKSSV